MLHYNPRRVSSCTMLIFRRLNCIFTASGSVTLHKRLYSTPVESGLRKFMESLQHITKPLQKNLIIITFMLLTTLLIKHSNLLILNYDKTFFFAKS